MKKFLKLFALLFVAGVMAFGMASCSNDSDDSDDNNDVVATFKGTVTQNNSTYTSTFTFYSDNTWTLAYADDSASAIVEKGTYTITSGDFTNGEIVVVCTQITNDQGASLTDTDYKTNTSYTKKITISGGTFTLNDGITNADTKYTKQ